MIVFVIFILLLVTWTLYQGLCDPDKRGHKYLQNCRPLGRPVNRDDKKR